MFRTQGYMMIQSTRDLAHRHEWNEANLFNFSHHLHSSFNSSQKIRSRGPRILKSLFFLPKVRTWAKGCSLAYIDSNIRAKFASPRPSSRARTSSLQCNFFAHATLTRATFAHARTSFAHAKSTEWNPFLAPFLAHANSIFAHAKQTRARELHLRLRESQAQFKS